MSTGRVRITLCVAVLLCAGNAALGQATITKKIMVEDEEREWITAELGDMWCVKLAVDNSYDGPVLVVDDLGSALRYLAGTCMLDGAPLTPTLSDNKMSFPVEPGPHEITYEFQVIQVEAVNTLISSTAEVQSPAPESVVNGEHAVQITLSPYNGSYKNFWCKSHPTYPDDLPALPLGQDVVFVMEVNIRNYFDFTMEDLEVHDDLPAEFEVDDHWEETGDLTQTIRKGKAHKVSWVWSIGDLIPTAKTDDGVSLKIWLSTARNPAGKQHFIAPGWYDVAKEVVVKFKDPSTGNELRAHTGSFSVYADDL